MAAKHFVNDPTHLVNSALRSLSITNPSVRLDTENKIIFARQPNASNVAIVSGGGSGHEPSFAGFVGAGVLSAAVAGTIFASPSTKQVLAAIEGLESEQILINVMNYTGDVLNFGVAVEKAKARNPRKKIEMLVVGDDVGVPRSRFGKVGRRGIAGTVLVHKVTGAAAAEGLKLEDVIKVGKLVSENLVSIGVSLERVHVPGRPVEDSEDNVLAANEVELGMGIHNEPGSGKKSGADAELPALVKEMLRMLLDPKDTERGFLQKAPGKSVLLINNLGSLSVLELGAVVTEVSDQLKQTYSISPERVYAGTYMTSLNGPGFSISLLDVVDTGLSKSIIELLDAPSEVAGWAAPVQAKTWTTTWSEEKAGTSGPQQTESASKTTLKADMDTTSKVLKAGLDALVLSEPEVTRYDSIVGDGDCGTTLKRGAEGIFPLISTPPSDIVTLLTQIAASIEGTMDGTSGALYSIYLNALTQYFKLQSESSATVDAAFWAEALSHASTALSKYTPAQIGHRTLVDALEPFVKTLAATKSVKEAAKAASDGAEKTKSMHASLGRAVYVGGESEWVGKIPDPGAWGLSKFFEGLANAS